MTYRKTVSNGMVLIEGEKPADGTVVEVSPLSPDQNTAATHPAIGIWKDRTDLPPDAIEASEVLRGKLMANEYE